MLPAPLADHAPGATFHQIHGAAPVGWSHTNPSVHPTAQEASAFVRLVNFRGHYPAHVHAHDVDGMIRTRGRLATFDERLRQTGLVDIRDDTPEGRTTGCIVRGFEDWRLFEHGGQELAVASMRSANDRCVAQQFLLRLDDASISSATALSSPVEGHQKNWMPVVGADQLTFVDRCAPLRLRIVDSATGTCRTIDHGDGPALARGFRGGSQLVPWRDGWIAIVHEVAGDETGRRSYSHRVVRFDGGLRAAACSDRFVFIGHGVEFCAGLRLDHDRRQAVASFGNDDRTAWLVELPVEELVTTMHPFEELDAPPRVESHTTAPTRRSASPPQPGTVPRPEIVSVTMSHAGREPQLAAALASVAGQVDRCLVVATDDSAETHRVAAEVAGDRLLTAHQRWPGSFADARNAALAAAADSGATWALIVDSDETMHFGGHRLTDMLATVPADVGSLTADIVDGSYSKIRLVRLPSTGAFVGATHEYFDTRGGRQQKLSGMRFTEAPKGADELAAKSARDIELLQRETARRPGESRWWYYLGDALAIAGRRIEAITAFRRCSETDGWAEETAWACYREAGLWLEHGRPDEAIERCAAGMQQHPGVAELPWLAGVAAWRGGRLADAVAFANLAIVHGEYVGLAAETSRTSFRHLPALYEGPFDVLRHAYRAQGHTAAADRAEHDHRAARAARLAAAAPCHDVEGREPQHRVDEA